MEVIGIFEDFYSHLGECGGSRSAGESGALENVSFAFFLYFRFLLHWRGVCFGFGSCFLLDTLPNRPEGIIFSMQYMY